MNLINILNFPFFEFTSSDLLADSIYSKMLEINFRNENVYNKIHSHTENFYDATLYTWFDKCLEEVHKQLLFKKTIKIEITSCWANKTSRMQSHHKHTHPNSLFSGVYYPENSTSPLIFSTQNIWFQHFPQLLLTDNGFENDKHLGMPVTGKYLPKKGSLIIFPSYISHGVAGVSDKDRYSIAFNTFVSGNLCTFHREASRSTENNTMALNIQTKNIKSNET